MKNRIKTNRGVAFDVEWFGTTLNRTRVYGEIIPGDTIQRISDVVDFFEDLEYIDSYDTYGEMTRYYVGRDIQSISWSDNNTILISFKRVNP